MQQLGKMSKALCRVKKVNLRTYMLYDSICMTSSISAQRQRTQWLPGLSDGGYNYKEVARGRFVKMQSSVFWSCQWLSEYTEKMNCHGIIHTHYTHVNFLVLVLYYSYRRCNPWGNWVKDTQVLYYFSTSCESIFENKVLKKNLNIYQISQLTYKNLQLPVFQNTSTFQTEENGSLYTSLKVGLIFYNFFNQ